MVSVNTRDIIETIIWLEHDLELSFDPTPTTSSGNSIIQCLENGTWSSQYPVCDELFCPDVVSPDYGTVSLSITLETGVRNGTVATVSCNNGFTYNSTENDITCLYGENINLFPTIR